MFERAPEAFSANDGDLVAGCVLLLVGAFAKSAQVPLHTWLPDAMEGPTPVSALIHAATMVTAGVYLIARMHPLFELAPAAADVGAIVGCLTLLMAATIAIAVTDLKRVIAYSTMSQIGYMVMAVSSGAYAAGLFHLYTHAFFKALLFMAAGSMIGAMAGVQSLDRMGGFRRAMPFTFGCFVVGGLALAGVPPFSGFFSKDEILAVRRRARRLALGAVRRRLRGGAGDGGLHVPHDLPRLPGRAGAGGARAGVRATCHHADVPANPMTGEEEDTDVGFPGPEHHIAERSAPMRVGDGRAGVGAVVGGVVQIPHVTAVIEHFLAPTLRGLGALEATPPDELTVVGLGAGRGGGPGRHRDRLGGLGAPARHRASACAERLAAPCTPCSAQVVLRRASTTRRSCAQALALGRFVQRDFERAVVQRGLVGGTTGIVRARLGRGARRADRPGAHYAALLVVGAGRVGLYFLLAA